MEVKHKRLTLATVRESTSHMAFRVKETLAKAKKLEFDLDFKDRRQKQQCVWCFYYDYRFGGQAMTNSNCASCNKDGMFGSTDVDLLCLPCAKELNLCVHCGADMELKSRRRLTPLIDTDQNWPVVPERPPVDRETRVFMLPKKYPSPLRTGVENEVS
jgi:hypothetical protein